MYSNEVETQEKVKVLEIKNKVQHIFAKEGYIYTYQSYIIIILIILLFYDRIKQTYIFVMCIPS